MLIFPKLSPPVSESVFTRFIACFNSEELCYVFIQQIVFFCVSSDAFYLSCLLAKLHSLVEINSPSTQWVTAGDIPLLLIKLFCTMRFDRT